MNKEQKNIFAKGLQMLSSVMFENTKLAKYVTTDGVEIEVADDGTTVTADGQYTLEDGKVMTVASGVATVADAVDQSLADVAATDAVDPDAEQDAIDTQKIADLEAKVAELEKAVADMQAAEVTEKAAMSKVKLSLEAKIAELENTPATDSVNLSNQNAKQMTQVELRLQRYFEGK